MFLVDHLHQHGIGVILDWVPSHSFDGHGLPTSMARTCSSIPIRGRVSIQTGSTHTNYGRAEVRSFLMSSHVLAG